MAASEASPLGRPRLHLRRVDSTNRVARDLASRGAPHGALVTASEQTAGRGRQGRSWSAPAGRALLMSLVLRDPPPLLPLIAGVAVCDVAGVQAAVKWPNDVVLCDPRGRDATLRKVAGILAEGRPADGWAVLGVGLNVAVRDTDLPPELRARAASLALAPSAIETTLTRVLASLSRWLQADAAAILDAWRERDALREREISWAAGHGRAVGLDGEGRLLVVRPDGTRVALSAGEVHLTSGAVQQLS